MVISPASPARVGLRGGGAAELSCQGGSEMSGLTESWEVTRKFKKGVIGAEESDREVEWTGHLIC